MAKTKAKVKNKASKPFSFEKFWCIWNIIEAILILGAGICGLVFGALYKEGNNSSLIVLDQVLPYVVGVFVIMDALLRIILGLNSRGKETDESVMLVAGFELTAGVLVAIFHDVFTRLIINAIGILLIVIGVLMIIFSIMVIVKKSKKLFVPILEMIFAAILVGVGIAVLILFYMTGSKDQLVLIVSGIIFSIVGLAQLIITSIKLAKLNKGEKLVLQGDELRFQQPVAIEEEKPVEEIIEAKEETKEIEVKDEPKAIEQKDEPKAE